MEGKERFLDKCKRWKETPIEINKNKSFNNIFLLLLATVLFLATIIGGYNFLTEVLILFSCFWALAIFIQVVFKNKLNIYLLASYGIMVFGAAFTFITRGADGFWYRFGYNFAFSLIPIICVTLLAIIPKLNNSKVNFYLTRVTSFCMIVGSLVYCLFMNIRIKPTCMDLTNGQEDYLNKVKNSGQADNQNPNVLLILMDDMAFSDISSYSYLGEDDATIQTPNIDSIGENGIMMDNCYSASPVSSPSRFSILTGRYSCRGYLDNVVFNTKQQNFPFSETRFFNPFQLAHNVDGLLGDEITVAEALKARGYDTGLFGKWNLGDYGEYLPTNQGFDYFFGSHYINDMIPYNVVREEGGEFEEVYSHNDMKDQSLSTERFTKELNTWMYKQVEGQKTNVEASKDANPFFIEYASPWPHFPIFSNANGNGEGDKSDDNYINCIQEFDAAVGTILDYLKETDDPRNPGQKLYDNTLVMFTSDNGPGREGVTGNLRGRKNTPFEGGYKVPFLASYPNGFGHTGDHLQSRCMNMDVFATILDFAGVNIMPEDRAIDGISMRELWTSSTLPGADLSKTDKNLHDRIYYFKGGSAKAIGGEFEAYSYVRAEDDTYVLNNQVVPAGTKDAKLYKKGQQMPELKDGKHITRMQDFKYYRNVQTENSAFFNQFYKDYLFNLDTDQAEGYNIAMRNDISVKPMTDEELNENKLINPIAKQLRQELEEFNKKIKDDKYRRTAKF